LGRDAFWSDPDVVARFRDRDPDIHLARMLESTPDPASFPTLDLGCAGGRNAVALRARGVPFVALDASAPMCAETRSRVGGRVVRARMDALPLPDASFALVAALGIYHEATSDSELRRAFAETARVLRPGGAVLASLFSRAMVPPGVVLVPGEQLTFDLPGRGPGVRLAEDQLVEEMERAGLVPAIPVEVRRGSSEHGERISLLGLFARHS
jgi:SAM-dependent methyltransferase